jgi:hypothetical protein
MDLVAWKPTIQGLLGQKLALVILIDTAKRLPLGRIQRVCRMSLCFVTTIKAPVLRTANYWIATRVIPLNSIIVRDSTRCHSLEYPLNKFQDGRNWLNLSEKNLVFGAPLGMVVAD